MPTAKVNGVNLFYEVHGGGEVTLVLVHGSWDSHADWDLLVPRLSSSFRVIAYDRRGHSQSERPAGQGTVLEDVADLAALLEHLRLAPAWIVGNSFGASIALRLAGARPELLRGLIAHEPPLFGLLKEDPAAAPLLEEVDRRLSIVIDLIASGDNAGAAEQFVDRVALGPGNWARLPRSLRQTFIQNAPTFLDETRDPEQLLFDLESVRDFAKPALITMGDQSPPAFAPVIPILARAFPCAKVEAVPGAGHVPHATHPDRYADAIIAFIASQQSKEP